MSMPLSGYPYIKPARQKTSLLGVENYNAIGKSFFSFKAFHHNLLAHQGVDTQLCSKNT